jgi:hypothetical protein
VVAALHAFLAEKVRATGRVQPNIDGSDFGPELVRELDTRHVLFEVWGNLIISRRGSGNVTKAQGIIDYLMIPIPKPKDSTSWRTPQLHQVDFRSDEVPLSDLFTKVFKQGDEFEILASSAFAIQARYNGNYAGAHLAFCHAKLTLEQQSRRGAWKDTAIDARMLASGIEHLVQENDAAAVNSHTNNGGLGLEEIIREPGCPRV